MRRGTLPEVQGFLAETRLAVVGVSRDPADFSRGLVAELIRRGYDVVPVSPHLAEVAGRRCYARVQDVSPPVRAALLLTPASAAGAVVRDCAQAGVARVWMHRGAGRGAVDPGAVAYCRENHIAVVPGTCVYMHLPRAGMIHRLHRVLDRLVHRSGGSA